MRTRTSLTAVIVGAALTLTGCAAPTPDPTLDPYAEALGNCLSAYADAPKWTEDLGGPSGACDEWEESQGRDEFVAFWTDEDEWGEYMETVYLLEE
jgi:hypothetical protein